MPLYDTIGLGYAARRRPDPRIAAVIDAALRDASSVVNVGAGTGSYEPTTRRVVAVEPSTVMISQRASDAAPCLQGVAESLPLETKSVDAAMAVLTMHHWTDLARGLAELRRVARSHAVLVTWVPDAAPFWLTDDYFPEIVAHDRTVFPAERELLAVVERAIGPAHAAPIGIPHDCTDGFLCAYWRRPEAYLRDDVRRAISSFSRFDPAAGLTRLRDDLASGAWRARHGHVLEHDAMDFGYRIVIAEVC
ncbi:MAG: class I SAM-dependent methyltransferase [Phycisphaerae bacterium]|nr:class I SAM-dependent methyltransferase [Phycisphaerae bacterium]